MKTQGNTAFQSLSYLTAEAVRTKMKALTVDRREPCFCHVTGSGEAGGFEITTPGCSSSWPGSKWQDWKQLITSAVKNGEGMMNEFMFAHA